MALGAGSVTPMQMATGYSVFANGGYRVNPWLITKVTEQRGKVLVIKPKHPCWTSRTGHRCPQRLSHEQPAAGGHPFRHCSSAQGTLKRPDLYGKTGTTNDSMDAWFAGYQPTLAAVTWIGYDTPKNLGDRETGGGLSLPVWISFMDSALKNVPVMESAYPKASSLRRRVVF
jgi:penicillin-binding protein 1A